jgi:hypothetical protein
MQLRLITPLHLHTNLNQTSLSATCAVAALTIAQATSPAQFFNLSYIWRNLMSVFSINPKTSRGGGQNGY